MKRIIIILMFVVFALASSAQSSGGMIRRTSPQKKTTSTYKPRTMQRKKSGATVTKAEARYYVVDFIVWNNDEAGEEYIDDDETIYGYNLSLQKNDLQKEYIVMQYRLDEGSVKNMDMKAEKNKLIRGFRETPEIIRYMKIADIGVFYYIKDKSGGEAYFYIEANEL